MAQTNISFQVKLFVFPKESVTFVIFKYKTFYPENYMLFVGYIKRQINNFMSTFKILTQIV